MTAYHDEHENLLASSLPPKMAADIVERLRERADGEEDNYFHGGGTNGLYPLLREAATEIETLRKRVGEVEAERDRLREALTEIAASKPGAWMDRVNRYEELASAALTNNQEEPKHADL